MPGWPHAVATSRHRLNTSARGAALGTSTAPRRTERATIPAPRVRQLSSRASAHPYAQVISMARKLPGVMGLTRCTVAKGPAHTSGQSGPVCAISLTPRPVPHEEEPRFAWSGSLWAYLQAQVAADQTAAVSRAEASSDLACDDFRRGGCCTLLLYEALEPWARYFELCF